MAAIEVLLAKQTIALTTLSSEWERLLRDQCPNGTTPRTLGPDPGLDAYVRSVGEP